MAGALDQVEGERRCLGPALSQRHALVRAGLMWNGSWVLQPISASSDWRGKPLLPSPGPARDTWPFHLLVVKSRRFQSSSASTNSITNYRLCSPTIGEEGPLWLSDPSSLNDLLKAQSPTGSTQLAGGPACAQLWLLRR